MTWMAKASRIGLLGLLPWIPARAQSTAAKWMSRASLPTARAETGAARLGDKIYLACGFAGGLNPSKDAYAYTPGKNAWQTLASVPVALHHTAMAAAGGKLYVMGGVTYGRGGGPRLNTGAEWSGSTTALEYNPAGDQWRTVKALPHATAAAGVVSFGGKIYVIGGVDAEGVALDLVQEYTPATDAWAMRSPMPTKREHVGAAVLDSLIYIVSGRVGQTSLTKLEAYSPASDKWYALKDMPTVRSDVGFAQSGGKFYSMGGEKPGIFDLNEVYDPVGDSWKTSLKMTATRKAISAVAFEDTIFVFGGFSAGGSTNTVEAFVPPGGTASRLATEKRPGRSGHRSGARAFSGPYFAEAFPGPLFDAIGRPGHFDPGSRLIPGRGVRFAR
ncbi:MAG TPA: galactose oxidase [Fibrobacteria bacterium]|nr:galactose oxidase [Fibrobacteria bacterium]